MKNLRNKIKNKKGITLVALVVTIIVLIILAGITLNILFGENGVMSKTKFARNKNDKVTATEKINLKITNAQISIYSEQKKMATLKDLADRFCEDDDFDKVIEKTSVGSLTKISNENPTAIIAKLKDYSFEFEIDSSLQLVSIDGIAIANKNDSNNKFIMVYLDNVLLDDIPGQDSRI